MPPLSQSLKGVYFLFLFLGLIMDFFCDFCDDHVSFSSQVCTECGEPLVDNPEWGWDDEPDVDEAQEWHDFDPDC